MTIRFRQWNCEIRRMYYGNNRTAIRLVDANDGSPTATASVNITGHSKSEWKTLAEFCGCTPDQLVFIKDYSENEGMLDALVSQGIVKDTGHRHHTGHVEVPLCILDEKYL
uniref:Uncharacterized protein n=2 Tax=viral metagenome TaxID=1070528 RepID=A0A6M3IWQ2_9ZZZZ